MAKMTYEEAIAFMEQHAIYCETGTRPDWYTPLPDERKPVYWIRLAEYMSKKREAELVLNAELVKMVEQMLGAPAEVIAAAIGDVIEIEVRDGKVVSASLLSRKQSSEPDLTNIKPVGGIQ